MSSITSFLAANEGAPRRPPPPRGGPRGGGGAGHGMTYVRLASGMVAVRANLRVWWRLVSNDSLICSWSVGPGTNLWGAQRGMSHVWVIHKDSQRSVGNGTKNL